METDSNTVTQVGEIGEESTHEEHLEQVPYEIVEENNEVEQELDQESVVVEGDSVEHGNEEMNNKEITVAVVNDNIPESEDHNALINTETYEASGSEVTGKETVRPTVLILSPDGKVTVTAVEDTNGGEVGEPSAKRYKLEQDGNTYVFSVPDGTTEEALKEHLSIGQHNTVTNTNTNICVNRTSQAIGEKTDITQAWFTTRDDKNVLHKKGHDWKQGQWSKEEIEILKCNISQYCEARGITDPTEIIFEMSKDERKDFYRTVSRNLQRPLFSVYRRVIRMYDQKNHMGKYTPQELQKLKELRQKLGNDWASIGAELGRSAASVKDRCRLMKDTCNSGVNVTSGLSWASVAERVGTRSEKQCRTKWLNYLNWRQNGGTEWTRDDDIQLITRLADTGAADENEVDWTALAKDWPSARSPQWLRGKWWTLKRHVLDKDLISFQDLVAYLRDTNAQTIRMRPPPNILLARMETPRVSVMQNMSFTVPSSYATSAIGHSVVNVDGSTNLVSTSVEDNPGGFHAYEVLSQLPGTTSGAYLIAQQTNSSQAIQLSSSTVGSDHIIVHTLPITSEQDAGMQSSENVTVEINQTGQVPVILTEEQDNTATAQHLANQEIANLEAGEEDEATPEDETDGRNQSRVSFTEANGDQAALVEGTVSEELVHTSARYRRSTSSDGDLLHKMATLKDPMLPSESELIGQSSDVEVEKSQQQETQE
ncbi:unnamed protein product [Owenia fusiformis]|uniref:Uncharacterized protein n=1 Tax=Owenia fusiformis TaxID=6347 RepID=A0A8J1T6U6_OWEFU|nr:unnamed protein product [Owenia fusiformis]